VPARRLPLFVALVSVLATACSGGAKPAAGRRISAATSSPAAEAPAPRPVKNAHLLAEAPRVMMFAGPQSSVGVVTRYCRPAECAVRPGGAPRFVESAAGGPVLFALGQTPVEAGLDIRTSAAAAPSRVPLRPGTVIVYQASLTPGKYLLTLVARFPGSEANWLFGLTVRR
jgi:hypothetical protein